MEIIITIGILSLLFFRFKPESRFYKSVFYFILLLLQD